MLFGEQAGADGGIVRWQIAIGGEVIAAALGIMSDGPEFAAIFPAGGGAAHDVFLDKTGDEFAAGKEHLQGSIRRDVFGMVGDNEMPAAGELGGGEVGLGDGLTRAGGAKAEGCAHGDRRFAFDGEPGEGVAHGVEVC